MRHRIISTRDIAQHPVGSLAPSDYIFNAGDVVERRDDKTRLVVREQAKNVLRVARVEYVPGTRAAFSCTLIPDVTIFEVRR